MHVIVENIILICPASIKQMPYINSYIRELTKLDCNLQYIVWDRLGEEEEVNNTYIYRDNKSGYVRGFFDYLNYSKFVKDILGKNKDVRKVVIFGIPLCYFLCDHLAKYFEYIVDIRDYHVLSKIYFRFKKHLLKSKVCVISSPGFKQWLPLGPNYITNHNSDAEVDDIEDVLLDTKKQILNISCIGALKDYSIIEELLSEANERKISSILFNFHGEGIINDRLCRLSEKLGNVNFKLTGRYSKNDERDLYIISDWINMFMSRGSLNNETCLSNRLYNSIIYGRPLLCYKGSYIADVVRQYNCGLVFNDVDDFFDNYKMLTSSFDSTLYNRGRRDFFHEV